MEGFIGSLSCQQAFTNLKMGGVNVLMALMALCFFFLFNDAESALVCMFTKTNFLHFNLGVSFFWFFGLHIQHLSFGDVLLLLSTRCFVGVACCSCYVPLVLGEELKLLLQLLRLLLVFFDVFGNLLLDFKHLRTLRIFSFWPFFRFQILCCRFECSCCINMMDEITSHMTTIGTVTSKAAGLAMVELRIPLCHQCLFTLFFSSLIFINGFKHKFQVLTLSLLM